MKGNMLVEEPVVELPTHAVRAQVALSGRRPVRVQHAHLPRQRVLRCLQGGVQCICGPVRPHSPLLPRKMFS